MDNWTVENYIESSINQGTIEEAYYYISMAIQNYRTVKVEPAGKCYLEGENSFFYNQMQLYYCTNLHSFCLLCLKNYIMDNFINYRLRIDYYCPFCENCTFYSHGNKLGFLRLVLGDFNAFISQATNSIIPVPLAVNFIEPKMNPELIELDPAREEYLSVTNNFYSTVKFKQVIKISKINNPVLEQKFNYKKNEFFANGFLCIQEVWHGTKLFETYKKIINNGFLVGGVDVKVNNGSAFGVGINTSLDASVCVPYCGSSKHILLCEAVTGQETNNPDEKDVRFNSFRGKNVLVLYSASQVIPRFLVNFK